MTKLKLNQFQAALRSYYSQHTRDLPWRHTTNPYHILVSELMLQQTQVERVIPKYLEFLKAFPSLNSLRVASLKEVLRLWQGLGYNRRAKYIHQIAGMVKELPKTVEELDMLPGIGPATAAAIVTYAYNQPVVFVETNVRTVFLYHFFAGKTEISDQAIEVIVRTAIDRNHPREWYWALMDYGTYLKGVHKASNVTSAHYVRQSKFAGSRRQLRGRIISLLAAHTTLSLSSISKIAGFDETRVHQALDQLIHEGLVFKKRSSYALPE